MFNNSISSNNNNNKTSSELVRVTAASAIGITSAASTSNVVSTPCINLIVEKHVWSKEQAEMLLDLYDENRDKFKNPAVRKIGIWGDIATEINTKFGTEFSAEQCHQKLRNFKNDFQKVMMLEKKDCRHFERLHRIFLQSAVKPSQSPAALKRKLSQLAGPKNGGTNIPSEKKRRLSLPDFRSRSLARNNRTHVQRTANKKTGMPTNTNELQSRPQPNDYDYIIGKQGTGTFSYRNSNFSVRTEASRNFIPTGQQGIYVTPSAIDKTAKLVDDVETSLSYSVPTMIVSSANGVYSAVHTTAEVYRAKEANKDSDKIMNVSHIIPEIETNGLPVPMYYFSSKGLRCSIDDPRGSEKVTNALPSGSSTVELQQPQLLTSEGNFATPTSSNEKSALGFIRGLFDNKKNREASKQATNSQEAVVKVAGPADNERASEEDKVGNGCGRTIIDLTDGQSNDSITQLFDAVNKWRVEAQEMEKARIQREIDAERRTDERHRESLLMTARFIELFEKLVSKVSSSVD
ncbi:uncharacterized protein LOC135690841 [Rhopilema esculentum]|uniref:uncharacterized protein LOC135690841 n=1 Tax=Rhopilema esculentum TaxID=499914 RepID=UPI0031D3A28E|eukprot:gene1928-16439_t